MKEENENLNQDDLQEIELEELTEDEEKDVEGGASISSVRWGGSSKRYAQDTYFLLPEGAILVDVSIVNGGGWRWRSMKRRGRNAVAFSGGANGTLRACVRYKYKDDSRGTIYKTNVRTGRTTDGIVDKNFY